MAERSIEFVLITGLSGAGKSEAMRAFEDLGYFCVDNLPPALIPKFAELCQQSGGTIRRIALASDIRGGGFFDELLEVLDNLVSSGFQFDIVFLDASDEALVRRFKETRRRHPLASLGIVEGINEERRKLRHVRARANLIIDTTDLSPRKLKDEIVRRLLHAREQERLTVNIISFGFKNGLPLDADLVFDVRFLPNPHYVPDLKPLTGNDASVVEYVFRSAITKAFMARLIDMVSFLLPHYVAEGKSQLIIGVGCTGGKHRSVSVGNALSEALHTKGYTCNVEHRDCPAPAAPSSSVEKRRSSSTGGK